MVIPEFHVDKLKGFMGTVGIVGGSVDDTGAAYFAAMTAYKVPILFIVHRSISSSPLVSYPLCSLMTHDDNDVLFYLLSRVYILAL